MKSVLAASFLVVVGVAFCLPAVGYTAEALPSISPAANTAPAGSPSNPVSPKGSQLPGSWQGGSASTAGTSVEDYSGGPRYRIGPEDIIRLSVWGNKELTLDVMVRPDGKISVPLIQDIQAEGLTASELAAGIELRLQEFIKDPKASIIVLQVNASRFYVVGNVKNPGMFPLRGEISILQALSLAGGFTEFASPRKIRLVRKSRDQQEVRVINYYDVVNKGGVGNYLLRPGDTVVVP